MARDTFLKTAATLVVLTFLVVHNFPAITWGGCAGFPQHRHPELGSGSIVPIKIWVRCTMDAETSSA